MKETVIIDTNLYMDDVKAIYKLSKEYNKIVIPITVLKELDKHKLNKDLSYEARNAIRSILDFTANNKDSIIFDVESFNEFKDPDSKILECGKKYNSTIATSDIAMSVIAESAGLNNTLYETKTTDLLNPYVYVTMNNLHEITGEDVFAYQSEYIDEEYDNIMTVFSKLAGRELEDDGWWFVFISSETNEPVIYANNPMKNKIERIDNKPKYREIKTDGKLIKARDCYQICAIYALECAPNTLITGRWGSGKTLLASAHAIAKTRKKTFITRAPLGINSKYNLGFMPGGMEEKMMDWLQGFMSALYYLYANTRNSADAGGKTYDYVKDELFSRRFQIIPMNSIQGLSLLDNDTLIVDEAQLIDISYMSMILSRPSETGRLVLLGDLNQAYDVVKPSESGLLKLLRVLPHKYMAYVELQNSYRSPLLEVADKLQDRSI